MGFLDGLVQCHLLDVVDLRATAFAFQGNLSLSDVLGVAVRPHGLLCVQSLCCFLDSGLFAIVNALDDAVLDVVVLVKKLDCENVSLHCSVAVFIVLPPLFKLLFVLFSVAKIIQIFHICNI